MTRILPPNQNRSRLRGVDKVLKNPLYDYQTYAAAGQTSLTFFSVPNGQGGKTLADTNMKIAGSLPVGEAATIQFIDVMFWPGNAVNGSGAIATSGLNWQDVYTVAKSGFLRFVIGNTEFCVDGPLGMFPASRASLALLLWPMPPPPPPLCIAKLTTQVSPACATRFRLRASSRISRLL